jgi:hypothetical protein
MTIQRRFEPDPEALERVAEILYTLLKDAPEDRQEGRESDSAVEQDPTCLPTQPE